MNQEMNPMGQPQKKGMSKGCLVGLIVGIVLIVIVVGGGLVCWLKKDAILKAGVVSMAEGIRSELNANPVDGVDSIYVNNVADAFREELEADEIELEPTAALLQALQLIYADKAVDAEEADRFIGLLVDFYPVLGELAPAEETMEDTSAVEDSLEQTD